MIKSMHNQRGAIALSVVGNLALLAILIIFAGKLIPVYLDNNAVKSMLANLETNRTVEFNSPSEVRNRIMKQLRVNAVTDIGVDAVSVVRGRDFFEVDITYQIKLPLAYNAEMLLSFSEQAEIPKN
ncbi:MAG: DUF4845 domain-containing protein [Chromatiales bacterium]|nr:DUF4845 domain-containing protein [Chromatiales bacterium]